MMAPNALLQGEFRPSGRLSAVIYNKLTKDVSIIK
jgi:hypothetical protein